MSLSSFPTIQPISATFYGQNIKTVVINMHTDLEVEKVYGKMFVLPPTVVVLSRLDGTGITQTVYKGLG